MKTKADFHPLFPPPPSETLRWFHGVNSGGLIPASKKSLPQNFP